MAHLAQLLASHDRILVLDAASARVQAGLLLSGRPAIWAAAADEAGKAVFAGTESILAQAGLRIDDITAFIFCEGPGSMLGIRTVAMALRTWLALKSRPVFAYQSLAVAAVHEWQHKAGRGFTVIADARRDTWHCQEIDLEGRMRPLRRVATKDLPPGELLVPEHFRTWSKLEKPPAPCGYDLAPIFRAVRNGEFFRPVDAPDAFEHEAPVYRKWSAQTHSAETAARK